MRTQRFWILFLGWFEKVRVTTGCLSRVAAKDCSRGRRPWFGILERMSRYATQFPPDTPHLGLFSIYKWTSPTVFRTRGVNLHSVGRTDFTTVDENRLLCPRQHVSDIVGFRLVSWAKS